MLSTDYEKLNYQSIFDFSSQIRLQRYLPYFKQSLLVPLDNQVIFLHQHQFA